MLNDRTVWESECGNFAVCITGERHKAFTVFKPYAGNLNATESDSSYLFNESGKSIAVARAQYLERRFKEANQ